MYSRRFVGPVIEGEVNEYLIQLYRLGRLPDKGKLIGTFPKQLRKFNGRKKSVVRADTQSCSLRKFKAETDTVYQLRDYGKTYDHNNLKIEKNVKVKSAFQCKCYHQTARRLRLGQMRGGRIKERKTCQEPLDQPQLQCIHCPNFVCLQ